MAQEEAGASTLPSGALDAKKEMSIMAEKEMIENTLPPPTQQDFPPRDASLTPSPATQKKGVKRSKKPIISDSEVSVVVVSMLLTKVLSHLSIRIGIVLDTPLNPTHFLFCSVGAGHLFLQDEPFRAH